MHQFCTELDRGVLPGILPQTALRRDKAAIESSIIKPVGFPVSTKPSLPLINAALWAFKLI